MSMDVAGGVSDISNWSLSSVTASSIVVTLTT